MTNPRAVFDVTEVGAHYTTYLYDGSIVYDRSKVGGTVSAGLALKLVGDGTVGLTTDGSNVEGKLIKAEADGFCTVQDGGMATLPAGAAASFTRGRGVVGAVNGSSAPGYIRGVASATAAEIADGKGKVVSTAVTTAVVVDLGQAGAE